MWKALTLTGSVAFIQAQKQDAMPVEKFSISKPIAPEYLPHWSLGSDARITDGQIQLTANKQSQTGSLWNTHPSTMSAWSMELEFDITGGNKLGGDGFAVWYVQEPGLRGHVYGSADHWEGLGIFFDTFNNDNEGLNPAITVWHNDGRKVFHTDSDGERGSLASCTSQLRGKMSHPMYARITYEQQKLQLEMGSPAARGNVQWKKCLEAVVALPAVPHYFGVTSHTGALSDAHAVLSISTRDLAPDQHLQGREAPEAIEGELGDKEFQRQVLLHLNHLQGVLLEMDENMQLQARNIKQLQRAASISSDANQHTANILDQTGIHLKIEAQKTAKTLATLVAGGGGDGGSAGGTEGLARVYDGLREVHVDLKGELDELKNFRSEFHDNVYNTMGKHMGAAQDKMVEHLSGHVNTGFLILMVLLGLACVAVLAQKGWFPCCGPSRTLSRQTKTFFGNGDKFV